MKFPAKLMFNSLILAYDFIVNSFASVDPKKKPERNDTQKHHVDKYQKFCVNKSG